MPELAALVLAAGAGRRFGAIKPLAEVRGQPLVRHAIALADAVQPCSLQVVLGAQHEAIAARLPDSAGVIVHEGWQRGLGSSIAAGIRGLAGQPDGVLLLLVDQVALRTQALQALASRWRATPEAVACADYDGLPGVPAILPRRLFAALEALDGERGAKPLLLAEGDAALRLPMPEAAIDIDTPTDLARWLATSPD
ncbi:MAG: nucleotidyltransferase family protein [Thermomonas sp.]|uniref:nucleotidyltransferase family protein n=1 Tax=Thermomonas sp. TaxID=1971895 RepID=UPI001B67B9F8|nr:nucleotidyltransferase family protein [Thermomonas sp.]MBP7157486.1 nucleotidyltransferase family protein [Thermomonas sp.]MBP7788234.1 nucleotidyltransferase family protein [Thermomonas sp.]MBP8646913.1 nucleotidyltransferase family protein [Thermomonas sp.]HQY81232.1 nucleotidyltransferase family protein [Thermomonas sp.]